MRHILKASEMVKSLADSMGLSGETVQEIFGATPTNFPVYLSEELPFMAHRRNAVGITLAGRVYLHRPTIGNYPPGHLLALLRHEAEHVRQQRADPLFYPRYGLGWLWRVLRLLLQTRPGHGITTGAHIRVCMHKAYRWLPAERQAYNAEEMALRILKREQINRRSAGQPPAGQP